MAEELKDYGLDLAAVLRDTHAETMMRVGSLLDEFFELALKTKILKNCEKINESVFRGHGKLSSLASKIKKAHSLKLIDDVAFSDATLVRKIRNEFGHLKEKLHFDSAKVVALAEKLSTYQDANSNQDAILAANSKVIDQLKATSPAK